jgi:hypothetical protein
MAIDTARATVERSAGDEISRAIHLIAARPLGILSEM